MRHERPPGALLEPPVRGSVAVSLLATQTRAMQFSDCDTRLAAYAFITAPNRGLLLTWFNGSRPQWTLPGGGVDYGESMEEAVVREVREETGHDVASAAR